MVKGLFKGFGLEFGGDLYISLRMAMTNCLGPLNSMVKDLVRFYSEDNVSKI